MSRSMPEVAPPSRWSAAPIERPVRLAVPGEHMVSNALAAAAVGLELGVPLATAAEALGRANVSRWRMESFTTPSGIRVLNDSYNANPESMAAALKTARWMAGDARCIAVLGAMAELGPIADREHERVGELAARMRIDRVVVVGLDASLIATAAEREGVEPENVVAYEDIDQALADVIDHAHPGDLVLCKASTGRGPGTTGGGAPLRSILVAAAVGLAATLLGTPIAIRAFRVWGWGQRIREDGPHTHFEKMGTPTMGGIVVLLGSDRQLRRRSDHRRRVQPRRAGVGPGGRGVRAGGVRR